MTKAQKEITQKTLESIAQKWNKRYEGTSAKFEVKQHTIYVTFTVTRDGVEKPLNGPIISVDVSKKNPYSDDTFITMTKERAAKELKKFEHQLRNINFRSGWILK